MTGANRMIRRTAKKLGSAHAVEAIRLSDPVGYQVWKIRAIEDLIDSPSPEYSKMEALLEEAGVYFTGLACILGECLVDFLVYPNVVIEIGEGPCIRPKIASVRCVFNKVAESQGFQVIHVSRGALRRLELTAEGGTSGG